MFINIQHATRWYLFMKVFSPAHTIALVSWQPVGVGQAHRDTGQWDACRDVAEGNHAGMDREQRGNFLW